VIDEDEIEKFGEEITLRAGKIIRERFGDPSSLDIRNKRPADYVTDVDLASEALIVGEIGKRFPAHHVMAEESSRGGLGEGITWVVDPLDGTTNFIHGFPFVAVSIGVCVAGRVECGFVYDPLRDELFKAVRGKGAHLNGKRFQIRKGAPLGEALVATGFPYHIRWAVGPYLETFGEVLVQVSGLRRAGSAALDLAYTAFGRVDGFWELGLKAWDVAAGSLLVEEAGGTVSDFWGRANFLGNGHIVAGSDAVYPCLMSAVGKHLAPVLKEG
jgi:myo-inositol-1(or 4)-monophosphatase